MVGAPGGGGGTARGERVIKLEGQITAREKMDSTEGGSTGRGGSIREGGSIERGQEAPGEGAALVCVGGNSTT